MRRLFFSTAFLCDHWVDNLLLDVDERGVIQRVEPGALCPPGAERIGGIAIAGLPNLHSHAHQRAIAGLGERSGDGGDSFWTWREVMYRALDRLTPDDFEAIAFQLYIEMAKAGFTSVTEFHYLHHDTDGHPYTDPAEMSHRVVRAARRAGLAVTLLPVLYAASGFGGLPPTPGQRRFLHDADSFGRLLDRLRTDYGDAPDVRLGIAPHSLRAVPPALLAEVVATHGDGPIHLHIAEQRLEVEDCLRHCGQRPVQWLFDHQAVDQRWCLIHATHLIESEIAALAASGAVVGLCPTTEANLGDGIFPAEAYLAQGGRFGIGSDSHISVSPVEDLRWLDYAQRLASGRRSVLAGGPHRSTARQLLTAAQAGGAQAGGWPVGGIAVGCRADIITLDDRHPLLAARSGDAVLDSWIFAGNAPLVRSVIVGGRPIVIDGHHAREEAAATAFAQTLRRLFP
jgi:formimidoylglutamate deiminase